MKIIITGGAGTIGQAILRNYPENDYLAICRTELHAVKLRERFPNYQVALGTIEDLSFLIRTFTAFKPDVVIHAAAMKHVDLVEQQPITAIKINVLGSLNIIEASTLCEVPVTVGISTDKACTCENVYGATKWLMERSFLAANTEKVKFSLARFSNVAHSTGSVIPKWLEAAKMGKPLELTDDHMVRLMFTSSEAASLIMHIVGETQISGGGFIGTYLTRAVRLLDLARAISDNVIITGRRSGETFVEDLISRDELPYTQYISGHFVKITKTKNDDLKTCLLSPYSAANAKTMSSEELLQLIKHEENTNNTSK